MRISIAAIIVAIFCLPGVVCTAQPLTGGAAAKAAPPAAPSTPPTMSGILKPSLETVQQAVNALKLEKWKKGTVRDEAGENAKRILVDLQTNLPPLLTVADSAPEKISNELPVSRNIDALYDVLLRVYEAARVSAPPEQITQLDEALNSLSNARLALDGRLRESAASMEKQVSDLQSTLQAQDAIKCPTPKPAPAIPFCIAPKPAVRRPIKKPAPPATPPQTTPPAAPVTPKPQN
jgi:hypothetical protein